MSQPLMLTGGRICTPDAILSDAVLVIEGGHIAAIGPEPADFAGQRIDLAGALVTPGLIDTHLHGGLDYDMMDATPEALGEISRHLAAHGVTAWLPTTVACPAEQLDKILGVVARAMAEPMGGAAILGVHLESNFLAAKFKGAQPEMYLRPTDDPALLAVLGRHRETIRVVTLAPELPGALGLIRQLRSWGIVVAVGHSDATYEQVREAVAAGAGRVTHLCNAQRAFHHREPGVVGAALVTDALTAEVIADLVHVHPAGLQIAYRCKGADGLMLVSDALRGTGLPPGDYELGGQQTHLDGTVARLADGTIAGSTITLERAIANVTRSAGIPLHAAVTMATRSPARSIDLEDRGALVPGLRADLAVFDDDFQCLASMVGGAWAHRAAKAEALAW